MGTKKGKLYLVSYYNPNTKKIQVVLCLTSEEMNRAKSRDIPRFIKAETVKVKEVELSDEKGNLSALKSILNHFAGLNSMLNEILEAAANK